MKLLQFSIAAMLCLLTTSAQSQNIPQPLPDSLKDKELVHGKLENGFTYYIRKADAGSGKAHIRLVVKAGTFQEDDDQREQAHLLEHIGFKGSKNFPEDVYHYTNKMGAVKGRDVNATTGANLTQYFFTIPSTSENVKTIIDITKDIAVNLLIRPEDVEIEGKAVNAESRNAMGYGDRKLRAANPKLFGKSKYRLLQSEPLLTTETFHRATITRFYKDWYRPDLLSIICIGDIDPSVVQQQVSKVFADLKKTPDPRPRIEYPSFISVPNQLIKFSDKEQKDIRLEFFKKIKSPDINTIEGCRELVTGRLYNIMSAKYFSNMESAYNSRIVNFSHDYQENGIIGAKGLDVLLTLFTLRSISDIEPTIQEVYGMLNGIKKYGFTQDMLDNAKADLISDISGKKPDFHNRLDVYIDNFTHGDSIFDPEKKAQFQQQLLKTISLSDVHEFARKVISDNDRDLVLSVPLRFKDSVPELAAIEKWIMLSKAVNVKNKIETGPIAIRPFVPKAIGKVETVKNIPAVDATELVLSNGMSVLLKKFPGSQNVIINGVTSKGALSTGLTTIDALASAGIIANSGVANLDKFQLSGFLMADNISVSPFVENNYSGITGRLTGAVKIEQIEKLLLVIQQYMLAPAKNAEAFSDWKLRNKGTPYELLEPSFMIADSTKHFTGEPGKMLNIDPVRSYENAYKAYKMIFENAADFRFVITGDFDNEKVIPLIEKYLGHLSTSSFKSVSSFQHQVTPDNKKRRIIEGRFEYPKVRLVYTGNIHLSELDRIHLHIIRESLQKSLTYRLREQEKGIYNVNTAGKILYNDGGRYFYVVDFNTTPENMERHLNAAKDEVNKFKHLLIDTSVLHSILDTFKNKNLQKPVFWNDYLTDAYIAGWNPENLSGFDQLFQQVTPGSVQAFAQKYLTEESLIELIGKPIHQ